MRTSSFSGSWSIVLAALALVAGASGALAQTGRIEGRVTSELDGAPIAGARIRILGTALTAITDPNGFYNIADVPAGSYSVRVAAVEYRSHTLTDQTVVAGQTLTVAFVLGSIPFSLEEVVVTGVAEQTSTVKLPFVVEKLSAEDLPVAGVNVVESIRGKMAGVRIVRAQGTPGSAASVQLRGAASINVEGRSNEPLYVVDGVILTASMVDIDALDVASVEVVKGAAGAALYGARAASGVISIQTNRGRSMLDGQTRFALRSEVGVNGLERKIAQSQSHWYQVDANGNWIMTQTIGGMDVDTLVSPNDRALATRLGWRTKIDYVRDGAGDPLYAIADNRYSGVTYDNLDRFFNPGSFHTTTGTLTHRAGNTNFLASFHETREGGVVEGIEGYRRRGGRVNVDHYLAGKLEFSATAFYSQSSADDPQGGENAFYGLNFYPIDVNLLELNPNPRDANDFLVNPDASVVEANPIYSARNNDETHRRSRFLGSLRARWRPTDFFDLETDFSFDRGDRNRTFFFFRGFRTTDAPFESGGQLTKDHLLSQAINASLTATFSKTFGAGQLRTVTRARALVERAEVGFFQAQANQLLTGDVKDLDAGDPQLNDITSENREVRSLGYFLSTQLDYRDRYIIDALIRRDGSSLFGSNERWQWYYRLSGAYRLSQEPWWPFIDVLNEFKVRASRGTAGGRPNFFAQYETYDVSGGSVSKATLGNINLKPELVTETEVGIDLIALDRLALSLTYAKSVAEDQILRVPLAGYAGFEDRWDNAGTLDSKTWEASVEAAVIQRPDLSWRMSLVADRTRQVITDLTVPSFLQNGIYRFAPGERLGNMYGHRWATRCSEVFSPTAGFGASCNQFAVNDDGYLVPVGAGNTWTDGIDQNLYGTTITIDGIDYAWGLPFHAQEVQTNPQTGQVDTTIFLFMGNTFPDFNFGFGNTISYKGFTLYALFDAQIGGDIYNNTRQWPHRENNAWETDQAGKPMNQRKPIAYYTRLYDVNADNSHFVEDGSFVKFRELSLRYSFDVPDRIFQGRVKRIGVSLIGRNLITWSGYSGYDPEVLIGPNEPVWKRYDAFDYPNFRTFTAGITLEF
ncbi:MAG: SusC/RagA family TonB-linked outer membrane protein [Gemmatimonadales bacterium]